jgi:hypothetical protein
MEEFIIHSMLPVCMALISIGAVLIVASIVAVIIKDAIDY